MTDNIISLKTRSQRTGHGPREELSEEEKLARRHEAENRQNQIAAKIRSRLSSAERLSEDDAIKLAENFGRLIETSFPDKPKLAIREIARLAESNPDHVESRLKNRKRYIRLKNESHGSQVGKDGRVILNWFYGLCEIRGHKIEDRNKETMTLWPTESRNALIKLVNGSTLGSSQGPQLRAPSDRQKNFYELMDRFASKLSKETDVIKYFEGLRTEPYFLQWNWKKLQGHNPTSKEPPQLEKFIHRSEMAEDTRRYAEKLSFSFLEMNDGYDAELPSVRCGLIFFPLQILCFDHPITSQEFENRLNTPPTGAEYELFSQNKLTRIQEEPVWQEWRASDVPEQEIKQAIKKDQAKAKETMPRHWKRHQEDALKIRAIVESGFEPYPSDTFHALVDPETLETVDGSSWRTIWRYLQVQLFLGTTSDEPGTLKWGIFLNENGPSSGSMSPMRINDSAYGLIDGMYDADEFENLDFYSQWDWYINNDGTRYFCRPFELRDETIPRDQEIIGEQPDIHDKNWLAHELQRLSNPDIWDIVLNSEYLPMEHLSENSGTLWEAQQPSQHYRREIKPVFMPFIDSTEEWTPVGQNTLAAAIISSLAHSDGAEGFESQMRNAINERVRLFGEMMDRLNSKFDQALSKKNMSGETQE